MTMISLLFLHHNYININEKRTGLKIIVLTVYGLINSHLKMCSDWYFLHRTTIEIINVIHFLFPETMALNLITTLDPVPNPSHGLEHFRRPCL